MTLERTRLTLDQRVTLSTGIFLASVPVRSDSIAEHGLDSMTRKAQKSNRHILTVAIAMLVGLAACELTPVIRYVDPPVTVNPRPTFDPDTEPYVELGFYEEQLYGPLKEGEPCPVVHGLQGGAWSMPAIRTLGIAPVAFIECNVVVESTKEEVGYAAQDAIFYLSVDGYFEQLAFPIPIHHAPPNEILPIDDLFDEVATLHCLVLDTEGRSDSAEISVVLSDG